MNTENAEWGAELARMRAAVPLVHNITNYVAMNFMANALLAAGCAPAMVHAPEEAGEFAAQADALTINLGTLSLPWIEGMLQAVAAARAAGRPWALDPVAVGATRLRRDTAARLLALRPTAFRGNASEIVALAGWDGARGRGVDAGAPVTTAEPAARALARQTGATVAVTGAVDFVTDGQRAARIANGHARMPQVTALGCALTGVIGAFLATSPSAWTGTVAALAYYGLAGERAAAASAGPGSFAVAFLDALAALDAAAVTAGARVQQLAPSDASG